MTDTGFLSWSIAWFPKVFYIDGLLITMETPGKISWQRPASPDPLQMISGVTTKQGVYLGGDAPVYLRSSEFTLEWSIFDEGEFLHIIEAAGKTAFSAIEIIMGAWISDQWYIPAAVAGQTIWKTSRELPYDVLDITDPELGPKCFIDGVAQTRVASSPPSTNQFFVTVGSESTEVELPAGISGTWLTLRYPARMFIGSMGLTHDIDDSNRWQLKASCKEHLPNRSYTFTAP